MPLLEVKHVAKVEGEVTRRVFLSSDFAVTIWTDSISNPIGCQVIYDRDRSPHAISKRPGEEGPRLYSVSDGEGRAGKMKQSPVFGQAYLEVPRNLLERFEVESAAIDSPIREYISSVISKVLKR